MNRYLVNVMLAGDRNHVVCNKGPVSAAEIAVLKAIHGAESVYGVQLYKHDPDRDPLPDMNQAELREHLRLIYHNALPGASDPIVDKLFGPMGPLPTTLAQIGIDAKSEAVKMRAAAQAQMDAASLLEEQDDGEAALSPEEAAEIDALMSAGPPDAEAIGADVTRQPKTTLSLPVKTPEKV